MRVPVMDEKKELLLAVCPEPWQGEPVYVIPGNSLSSSAVVRSHIMFKPARKPRTHAVKRANRCRPNAFGGQNLSEKGNTQVSQLLLRLAVRNDPRLHASPSRENRGEARLRRNIARERVLKYHPFLGQLVNVRRRRPFVPVAAKMVRPRRVKRDKYYAHMSLPPGYFGGASPTDSANLGILPGSASPYYSAPGRGKVSLSSARREEVPNVAAVALPS